jgi:hypothetical protein
VAPVASAIVITQMWKPGTSRCSYVRSYCTFSTQSAKCGDFDDERRSRRYSYPHGLNRATDHFEFDRGYQVRLARRVRCHLRRQQSDQRNLSCKRLALPSLRASRKALRTLARSLWGSLDLFLGQRYGCPLMRPGGSAGDSGTTGHRTSRRPSTQQAKVNRHAKTDAQPQ